MAVNEALYRELLDSGLSHRAALRFADPANDTISGGAVADPPAVTSTNVAAADATTVTALDVASAPAVYDQVWGQSVRTLANEAKADLNAVVPLSSELKTDVNALRADVVALRTTMTNLLAALRTAGVID